MKLSMPVAATGGVIGDRRRRPTWRALLGCALLVAGLGWGGSGLVQALLPAAQAWIQWIEPAFTVRHVRVVDSPQGERIELQVSLARPVRVGETVVMPHPRGRAQARVPLAQGLQGPLLLGLVVLAWPVRWAGEVAVRTLLALPLAALLLALDTPIVLLSEIWQLLRQAHAADDWHPLVGGAGLLSHGGRFGLALLAAAAVLAAGRHAGRAGLAGRSRSRPAQRRG